MGRHDVFPHTALLPANLFERDKKEEEEKRALPDI